MHGLVIVVVVVVKGRKQECTHGLHSHIWLHHGVTQ
jgi:hypothetical protein